MNSLIVLAYVVGVIIAYIIFRKEFADKPKWEQIWYSVAWPATFAMYVLHLASKSDEDSSK